MASKTPPPDEPQIRRLEFDANRNGRSTTSQNSSRNLLDDDVSFMNEVAEGIIERDRRRMQREATRTLSFAWAITSCLCAGSITTFSCYGPNFQEVLHYTQFQVNGVSVAAELALYLSVPFWGYICDRYSPRPLSFLSAIMAGLGYILAAIVYKSGPLDQGGLPYGLMVLAFVGIGMGTLTLYLGSVATCAKNYATAKYRGLVLSLPIAAFGLSGMWISLVGEHAFATTLPDGRPGPVNTYKYFIFLAILFIVVGFIGSFLLNIVGEEDLIDHGIETLEQSGLLEESEYFRSNNQQTNYGTIESEGGNGSDVETASQDDTLLTQSQFLKRSEESVRLKEKKDWLLNQQTRSFLSDRTMWLLAAGFLLATGPGEAYINNLGTVIPTLSPLKYFDPADPAAGYASTHVSIIALTSTVARLFTGTISDLFAPPSKPQNPPSPRIRFSRLVLLIPSALILVLGFLNLALPFLTPAIPSLFHLSSVFVGLGYGAVFSLVPIIISVVWGPENFATNWGVVAMTPAAGATLWSFIYSAEFSRAAQSVGDCHGYRCFAGWAWGCAISALIAAVCWSFAWRTWVKRNVIV